MRLIDGDALKITLDTFATLVGFRGIYDRGQVMECIDAAPTIGGWISVKDRLPESGKHVLVCCEIRPSKKRYVCDGYYAAKHNIAAHYVDDDAAYEYDEEADEYFLLEGWYEVIRNWDEYSSIVIADFVTHWMPLPELPEEVSRDD